LPTPQRLLHIKEAIDEIQLYMINSDMKIFLANSMMRFACVKQIEIIGEAANIITTETKAQFADLEWKKIVRMRHILVHKYFPMDFELIWQVIINDLPELKVKILNVIHSISE
jgi:uncharacterized protein with HEPN domain